MLVGLDHELPAHADLGEMSARTGVTDVNADHPLDPLRMAHRELIAVEAAPIVQEERNAPVTDGRADRLDDLVECVGSFLPLEAGKRDGDALVAVLQRLDLGVPQPRRIRPAMDHDDGLAVPLPHAVSLSARRKADDDSFSGTQP